MKFSIITPSFNQAQFIEQTIKSVVSQKVDLEYLIIDGGSTDGSLKIIQKYAQKYQSIKYISEKDRGQSDAINKGLSMATGDIVAYLNSDDYYLPKTLSQVEEFFLSHPNSQWLVGNCQVTDAMLNWTFFLKHLWPIQHHHLFLEVFNTINQPSVFLTRQLVAKVGKFDESLNYTMDYDYWLRCQKLAGPPQRISVPLSIFRVHPGSKGNQAFQKQFAEDYTVISRYTNNRLILALHKLGMFLTLGAYRYLK